MEIADWGFRMEIVDHRPLAYIWVRLDNGTRAEVVASPHPFCQQLVAADVVAEGICDAEAYYDALVNSGAYRNLDEIDDVCRAKFGSLEFTTAPAPRIHD